MMTEKIGPCPESLKATIAEICEKMNSKYDLQRRTTSGSQNKKTARRR